MSLERDRYTLSAGSQNWLERACDQGWLFGLLLVAATLLAYQPAWHAGYIWDDDMYVTHNLLLTDADGLRRIWFSLDSPSQYFPLTYTVFRLEHALWGFNSTGYHLVNILLHAVNALLVWRVLRRLNIPGARLAAVLFALHPVMVESVAWVTELKNILSLLFSLLAVLAWIKFLELTAGRFSAGNFSPGNSRAELPSARKWLFYFLALGCQTLALAGKSTACTLPAALLLVAWLIEGESRKKKSDIPLTPTPLPEEGLFRTRPPVEPLDSAPRASAPLSFGRGVGVRGIFRFMGKGNFAPLRSRLLQVVPFLLLGVASGLLAMWWERYHQRTEGSVFGLGPLDRALIASRAVWFYLGKIFWPSNLAFSYPLWRISPSDPLAYSWLAACAAAAAIMLYLRRYVGRGLEVAALFFVATLAPLLGFIMLYTFHFTFVADHYQYVAALGPIALVAAAITLCRKPLQERLEPQISQMAQMEKKPGLNLCNLCHLWLQKLRLPLVATVALPAVLATLTWRQTHIYQNEEALWRGTIERNPAASLAHGNLGQLLAQKGKLEEALAHFRKAAEFNPTYGEAEFNIATTLGQLGRADEALDHFQRALKIRPDSAVARLNIAKLLIRKNHVDDAIPFLEKAIQIRPGYPEAELTLAGILAQKGRTDDALAHYESAAKAAPGLADAHYNAGMLLFQRGRLLEAALRLRQAAQLNPGYDDAYFRLANDLLRLGKVDAAIACFQDVAVIEPKRADAQYNLGLALLQKGDTDEAVAHLNKAVELQPGLTAAHALLGNVLLRNGEVREAIAHYENAAQAQQAEPAVLISLAWIRATAPQAEFRDGAEAVRLAEGACDATSQGDPACLRTLAAAYAEAGRFEDAVATAEKGREIALALGRQPLAEQLQKLIPIFKSRQPYRDQGQN